MKAALAHNLKLNHLPGSGWLPAQVGATVNKLIIELHYSGGHVYAYKQDCEPSILCFGVLPQSVNLPAVLLGVGR